MDLVDMNREFDKIREALDWAEKFFMHNSEMHAAQHCNDKVLYSPIVSKIDLAQSSLNVLVKSFTEQKKEDQEDQEEESLLCTWDENSQKWLPIPFANRNNYMLEQYPSEPDY